MIIAKAHTFAANNIAYACEVNRNFDDLFALVNGNLDSANLATAFTVEASNVTINDTASNFCASELESALIEAGNPNKVPVGFNGIHVTPLGSNACIFHPGKIEINKKECVILSEMQISGISVYDSCTAYQNIAFAASAVTVMTASDIFIIKASSAHVSALSYAVTSNGFYYGNKRVIEVVWGNGSSCQSFIEKQLRGGENRTFPYSYKTSSTEDMLHLGFCMVATASSGSFGWMEVTRIYNPRESTYDYLANGVFPSSTGIYLLYNTDVSPLYKGVVSDIRINVVDCEAGNIWIKAEEVAGVNILDGDYAVQMRITATAGYDRALAASFSMRGYFTSHFNN